MFPYLETGLFRGDQVKVMPSPHAPAGLPKCPGEHSDTHGDTDPVEGSSHSDWLP